MKGIFINHEILRGVTAQKVRALARDLNCNEIHLGRKINGKAKLRLEELNQIAAWLERDATDFIIVEDMDLHLNRGSFDGKIDENVGGA